MPEKILISRRKEGKRGCKSLWKIGREHTRQRCAGFIRREQFVDVGMRLTIRQRKEGGESIRRRKKGIIHGKRWWTMRQTST